MRIFCKIKFLEVMKMDRAYALLEQYRQLREATKGRTRDILAALKRVEPFLPQIVAEGTDTEAVLIGITAIEDKRTWFKRALSAEDFSALLTASTEKDEIGASARETLEAIAREQRQTLSLFAPA
jgi:hypothetical protein